MNKINIGIIGVGIIGERLINAFNKHERGHIKGIYDTNTERLTYISHKYNLMAVNDYKELLQDEDIQLIYLAVPPKHHHSIGLDIIKAGKSFFCEKPLANSIEEAREMYEEAEKKEIINAINFPIVYTPAFKKLQELIKEGFIGQLRRVEVNGYFQQWPRYWQQTDWIATKEQGGFVKEVFTHYVHMLQSLFGKIEDIQSDIQYPLDEAASELGIIASGKISNGIRVLFNGVAGIGMEEELTLTIYGSEAVLALKNWRELYASNEDKKLTKVALHESDHLLELIDELFKGVDGIKERNLVSFKEGYEAQGVIEKLLGNG